MRYKNENLSNLLRHVICILFFSRVSVLKQFNCTLTVTMVRIKHCAIAVSPIILRFLVAVSWNKYEFLGFAVRK